MTLTCQAAPNCRGWLLLKLGRLRIELWKVPAQTEIPPHNHPNIISRIIFLNGNMLVSRAGSRKRWPTKLIRWYRLNPGQEHYGRAAFGDGWFLNIEHWVGPMESKGSAAADWDAPQDLY